MVGETVAHILLVSFGSQGIYFYTSYRYAKTNHVAFDSFRNDYSHKHCWARVLHGDDQEQDLCSHTFNKPALQTDKKEAKPPVIRIIPRKKYPIEKRKLPEIKRYCHSVIFRFRYKALISTIIQVCFVNEIPVNSFHDKHDWHHCLCPSYRYACYD